MDESGDKSKEKNLDQKVSFSTTCSVTWKFCGFFKVILILFVCHYFQTLRRLAQNREAARKSRLRKKVGLSELLLLTYSVFTFTIKQKQRQLFKFLRRLMFSSWRTVG